MLGTGECAENRCLRSCTARDNKVEVSVGMDINREARPCVQLRHATLLQSCCLRPQSQPLNLLLDPTLAGHHRQGRSLSYTGHHLTSHLILTSIADDRVGYACLSSGTSFCHGRGLGAPPQHQTTSTFLRYNTLPTCPLYIHHDCHAPNHRVATPPTALEHFSRISISNMP